MDQFSAHLDRGWDLVQKGDIRGAAASAQRALELDPNSPEAYNLMGYVAALEGDSEDAVEAYRQAIALDETYLEAMLNAAEVYIHPLADFDQAIDMCDQALDLAEIDDEVVDALLLKFDALLGKGDLDGARKLVASFPGGPFENPNHTFLVGRALYEVGQGERAQAFIEEAIKRDPRNPEALYYLGLLKDEAGDGRGATAAFLRSRELDLSAGPPPWLPSQEDLGRMTERAIVKLSPMLAPLVSSADVFVTDVPGVELIADGVDPRALVVLDGVREDADRSGAARIFLYAINVARAAGGPDAMEKEIERALEREISATFLENSERAEPRQPKDLN